MKSTRIDDVMILSYPVSFLEMTEREMAEKQFLNDGKGLCISDPDSHILVSVGYQQVNGFAAMMLSGKDIITRDEKIIAKRMESLGYCREGFVKKDVSGKKADGMCYTYKKDDVVMYAESLVIKNGRTLCYLHYYTRNELKENNVRIWESILSRIQWQ